MRKIALMMDGWKRSFTYAWPAGILARIRETDEEVNLYTFNSSGDWSRDREYNVGEYNIYRLPDLNEFDGIIVDLNNIRYPDVRDRLIASAKAAGKPALAIANDIEGFYYGLFSPSLLHNHNHLDLVLPRLSLHTCATMQSRRMLF